jgi:hypothetical protein
VGNGGYSGDQKKRDIGPAWEHKQFTRAVNVSSFCCNCHSHICFFLVGCELESMPSDDHTKFSGLTR